MNIGDIALENLNSVRQALSVANLRRAMTQDAQSVAVLLSDMSDSTAKLLEHSVTPHKGTNIDISI